MCGGGSPPPVPPPQPSSEERALMRRQAESLDIQNQLLREQMSEARKTRSMMEDYFSIYQSDEMKDYLRSQN